MDDHAQVARFEIEQARGACTAPIVFCTRSRKPLHSVTDVVGFAQEGDDLVEDLKLAVLLFEAAGLGDDTLLERVIDVLDVGCHAVEAGRELAKLVLRQYRHAGIEILLPHARLTRGPVELGGAEHGADHGEDGVEKRSSRMVPITARATRITCEVRRMLVLRA